MIVQDPLASTDFDDNNSDPEPNLKDSSNRWVGSIDNPYIGAHTVLLWHIKQAKSPYLHSPNSDKS